MSYPDSFAAPGLVIHAAADARAAFIRRTYLHLAAAVLGFVSIEALLMQMPFTDQLVATMVGSRWGWLIVLGLFMGAGFLAERWARSATSVPMQYAGLFLYVLADAVVFLPLIYVAAYYTGWETIPSAGIVTLSMFGALTFTAFFTRFDFSFLRTGLMIAGFLAMGLIVAAIVLGFSLGLFFGFAMVGLASGYILYYTSQIMYHYRTDQHVAAALSLFAAVALLFYYVLMIFSRRD